MNPAFLSTSPRASRNLALAALLTLGLAWGVGDGVDKPMPGKDRFRR